MGEKIGGRFVYFGPWDDPDGALEAYQKFASGQSHEAEELTVKAMVNTFLVSKSNKVKSGELSQLTWLDYKIVCDLLVSHFGKYRS